MPKVVQIRIHGGTSIGAIIGVTVVLDCKHETELFFPLFYEPSIGSEQDCSHCDNERREGDEG